VILTSLTLGDPHRADAAVEQYARSIGQLVSGPYRRGLRRHHLGNGGGGVGVDLRARRAPATSAAGRAIARTRNRPAERAAPPGGRTPEETANSGRPAGPVVTSVHAARAVAAPLL
jgi:hypothetical protein